MTSFCEFCLVALLFQCIIVSSFHHFNLLKSSASKYDHIPSCILFSNPRKIDIGEGFSKESDLLKHGLLSFKDEFSLAKQFKLSVEILSQFYKLSENLGRQPSQDEVARSLGITREQIPSILEKGDAAKKTLVRANMRLVFHIAKHYKHRGVAYPDLVQEGTFGLIKAVDKYDHERGFRFSTYASWWIKQSVSRAVAEKSRIVRLPVHIHDLMVSISRLEKKFFMENSRKPTAQELAEILCLPVEKIELLLKCARDVNSIDDAVYQNRGKSTNGNEVQVKERIASKGNEPSNINEKNSLRDELRRTMRILSEKEAQIVEMRFGLQDGNPMTLEEIGKSFNVTRERIRQIEARALSKLRTPRKVKEFQEIFQDQSVVVPSSAVQSSYPPVMGVDEVLFE